MACDLDRFKKAQQVDYQIALREIKSGRKKSHWIWYIFPQLKGLGCSPTSEFYGLTVEEAKAYINDQLLKSRLLEISQALLDLHNNNVTEIMNYPDNLKLKSCMTLFGEISPEIDVFSKVLKKFYNGEKDEKTMALVKKGMKRVRMGYFAE